MRLINIVLLIIIILIILIIFYLLNEKGIIKQIKSYPNCKFDYKYYISGSAIMRNPINIKDCDPKFSLDSQIVLNIYNNYTSKYDQSTQNIENIFTNIIVIDPNLDLNQIVITEDNKQIVLKELVKKLVEDVSDINSINIENLYLKKL